MGRRIWLISLLVAAILTASRAHADSWIEVQLPRDQFGDLWNTDDGTKDGNGVPWCAPTAIVNSFQFLQNRYPGVYDKKLIPGTPLEARNQLQKGWTLPDGTKRTGTGCGDVKDVWQAKVHWVEDHAPKSTIFDGMVDYPGEDLSKWYGGSVLTNGAPTWDFLWTELSHKEDVELGFYWTMGGTKVGHMVTLTSLKFLDSGNGVWDPGTEQAKIDFIDPNNPTNLTWGDLTKTGSSLGFKYTYGGVQYDTTIYIAYAESPIPEPLTLAGLGLGLCGLVGYIRKRRSP
jgi:hypothetical protein